MHPEQSDSISTEHLGGLNTESEIATKLQAEGNWQPLPSL